MSSHLGDDDGYANFLSRAIQVTALAPALDDTLDALVAVGLDVSQLRALVAGKRGGMRAMLRAEGVADYREDFALAIFLYTLENPALYKAINGALRAKDRVSSGRLSDQLRACMPFVKFLCEALANAPAKFVFLGRCHRGVKWAFPSPDAHNPAAFFYPGKEFWWYDFKSTSEEFDTMYKPYFCGDRGPRTIFSIEGVRGVRISAFSAVASEKEVLFTPGSKFAVKRVQKKLRPQDLFAGAAAGGFPDEVQLGPAADAVPMAEGVPRELKLKQGLEQLEDGAPLGSGGFADVLRGTYPLPGHVGPPPAVAFKLFRNSLTLPPALRQQIMAEVRLGLRLDHDNLIQLFGVLEIPARGLALVMELADGGSIRTVLDDVATHPQIEWGLRLRWLDGISAGVAKLHSLLPQPVIHRDLKAANVLLSSPDLSQAVPKVCDFGVATIVQTSMATGMSAGASGSAGTLAFKAPETFRGRFSPASDVFGLAVLDWEMATRQSPWVGRSQQEVWRGMLIDSWSNTR
jgi:hypothetical protein